MASKKIVDALNSQINAESYSAYLYLAMSAWASVAGLKGAANWYFVQAQEEMTHAWRFYLYIQKLGQAVELQAIKQPPVEFKSLKHAFEETLKHEKYITSRINDLVNLARGEKDHATEVFLQWFVNEQVEEEENDMDILAKLKLAGSEGSGLFMVDAELAARMFVMPPDLPGGAAAAAAP
ncbi:MAG: ferritin [Verrucomicrobia bacterium]|nr:ferritin [Verrucomicrobiota bacterium]